MRYEFGTYRIRYEEGRPDGRCHAEVHLRNPSRGEPTEPSTVDFEVTLNGPGKNKAEKKINNEMRHRGLEVFLLRHVD